MKILIYSIILSLQVVSSLAAHASDFHNQMNGVVLKSCTPQNIKCIEIKFEKSEMSQWSSLFAFQNFEASFKNKNIITSYIGHSGYFDLDQNKILLKVSGPNSKEILVDLKSLQQQEFKL